MKQRLLAFVDALRAAGLRISVAETLDAMNAVSVAGVERPALREGLATTLVKDEADRSTFDATFERFFAAPRRRQGKGERPRPAPGGVGHGAGNADLGGTSKRHPDVPPPTRSGPRGESPRSERKPGDRHEQPRRSPEHRRSLLQLSFHEMSTHDVEECAALVADLAKRLHAHVHRRQRAARRGRLDMRRTLRRAAGTGGVPINPAFRTPRPRHPDLVALCDNSHSVAVASRFLFSLIAPAAHYFRRVRLFAFVDRPVEVSVEDGMLIPHGALDLYARSDFGRVLVTLWTERATLFTRNTVLLILGDARNNRRPPRADVLQRLRERVRRVVWLNPEPPARWDSGDSVMRSYRRSCDAVVAAGNLRELQAALRSELRGV